MEMKKIKTTFKIQDGKFVYMDIPVVRKVDGIHPKKIELNFVDELNKLKAENEGQLGEVSYEVVDSVQFYQHKYYRGYVLPAIADAQGEKDLEFCHLQLKQKFLYRAVADWREIPSRHRGRCVVVMDGVRVVAYIPSTATLNFEEMANFIIETDAIRDGLIDWQMPAEALRYRKLAFGEKE